MRHRHHQFFRNVILLLTLTGLIGCTYENTGQEEPIATAPPTPSQPKPAEKTQSQSAERGKEDRNIVFETVVFHKGKTDLTQQAKHSLTTIAEQASPARNDVIIRAVDPNEISGDNVNQITQNRFATISKFLEQTGINIDAIEMNRYSSREYHESVDAGPDSNEAKWGLSEADLSTEGLQDEDRLMVITMVEHSNGD